MTGSVQAIDGWRDVAAAIPGGVGILSDDRFVFACEELASLLERESSELTGRSLGTVFEGAVLDRIEQGIETARTEGQWTGDIAVTGQSLEVTLSAAEGFVLWICSRGGSTTTEMRELHRDGNQFMKQILDHLNDTVYIIAEDGRSWFWNDQLAETTGYSHEEIASMHPKEFIPEDQHEYVPGLRKPIPDTEDRRVHVDILSKDGERITHEFNGATVKDPESGQSFRCGTARNISERLERKRQLERQLDKLKVLNRINDLLFETARELIETGSRNAVERVVCDRLASSELYRSAWIGERQLDDEHIVARVSAGTDDIAETISLTEDGPGNPVVRGIDTKTVQVLHWSEETTVPWETTTTETDPEALLTVPLQHGETVYGTLVVGTDRTNAFGPQERAGFELLGRLIGVVVHAARSRELLFADTVAELEFDFSESESPFVDTARALDCQLGLDGYVPTQEGWVVYLTVEGVQPATAVERFVANDRVAGARCINDAGESGRLEVRMTALSVLQVVTDAGASVRRASATPETARFVIEAPVDIDLRQLATSITDAFPAATLIATRKRDREITTVGRPGGILDDLTDRQCEVLEAAYQAGYFAWPRESTAEEVAESLGLTSPTLHGHLRKAEQIILSNLLDES
jgi:PAS domain S-box-containing protein